MAQTLEEHLMCAALDGDHETVTRLVDDMLPGERRKLSDALESIQSRLT